MHAHTGASAEEIELLVTLFSISRQLKTRAATTEDRDHMTAVMLLHYMTGGGCLRLSDLAGCAGLDHSTVSRHVKRLEDLGLIDRAEDPSDRRASLLVITARGRALLDDAMRARAAALAEAMAGWPDADRRAFRELAGRLAAALEHAHTGENPA